MAPSRTSGNSHRITDDEALALEVKKLALATSDSPKKFYVVFHGRKPNVYKTWDECESQTKGFSNEIYKEYHTERRANQVFQYAKERGWIRSEDMPLDQFNPAIMPTPVTRKDSDNGPFMPRGKEDGWHVVRCGITPGVYGTWLEAALNVKNIKGNKHKKLKHPYKTKEEALEEYEKGIKKHSAK